MTARTVRALGALMRAVQGRVKARPLSNRSGRMTRILISNDDGIHAYGLPPLIDALTPLGEVWVVAPEREQSAQSHALTMHKPVSYTHLTLPTNREV